MKFCPNCNSALVRSSKGYESEPTLKCPKCGYEEKAEERIVISEARATSPIISIGEDEQALKTMPEAKVECPKCGNIGAYWWMVQLRGADESSTQFFRCTECGYTWRETK